jgi:3-oxoacyl-[acyl-carrier-protein] synthase II
MRRVAVTGLGVVAPNGVGRPEFWAACVNGRSAVRPIRSFDASAHPVRVAAEVPNFDVEPYLAPEQRKSMKIMGRAARFGVGAAVMAVQDSGLNLKAENLERVGVVMGTGLIPMDLAEIAPLLCQACNGNGHVEPRQLGQNGAALLFPAVDPEIPAQHGRHAHLAGAQGARAQQHDHHRLRGRHAGNR